MRRLLSALAIGALAAACAGPPEPDGSGVAVESGTPATVGRAQPTLPGFDGEAFIDALGAEGMLCEGPKDFTADLSQWDCAAEPPDLPGVRYEVVILGATLDEVHSIDASVDQSAARDVDPTASAGFLASIALGAQFEGADPRAAADWAFRHRPAEPVEMRVGNVTYLLRGPELLRGLQIVAQEP